MKWFVLPLLTILAITPAQAGKLVAEPFPPARFAGLYIENDDRSGTTIVQLSGDSLIYKRTDGGSKVLESTTINPSPDDWFKFIQGLNSAKVYNWAPKYEYPGQGPSWVIDLTMDDRKFYSEGTNDYPKNGDESQPQADPKAGTSIPFDQFWQAVLELCGKAKPAPLVK